MQTFFLHRNSYEKSPPNFDPGTEKMKNYSDILMKAKFFKSVDKLFSALHNKKILSERDNSITLLPKISCLLCSLVFSDSNVNAMHSPNSIYAISNLSIYFFQ